MKVVFAAGEVRCLVFVLALSKDFAINLQLLVVRGIRKTLPAIVGGLYTLLAVRRLGGRHGVGHLAGVRRQVADPGPLRRASGEPAVVGHHEGLHRDDPEKLYPACSALRKQIAATAANLASIEEDIARVHDELAARRSSHSSEDRRAADEARKGHSGPRNRAQV